MQTLFPDHLLFRAVYSQLDLTNSILIRLINCIFSNFATFPYIWKRDIPHPTKKTETALVCFKQPLFKTSDIRPCFYLTNHPLHTHTHILRFFILTPYLAWIYVFSHCLVSRASSSDSFSNQFLSQF